MYSAIREGLSGVGVKKIERNGLIDIMRLVFTLLVVMFHFYSRDKRHFSGGALGVEFFVILSGVFFYSSWGRHCDVLISYQARKNYWMKYMKKRYIRFFGYSLGAYIIAFLLVYLWRDHLYSPVDICDKLSRDIWEILLVKMNGLNRGMGLLNAPAWTLSSMLIAEFFILGMLVYWEEPFLNLFMPLSVLCGVGYWANMSDPETTFVHFTTFATMRVYLLTCFGIFSYKLSQKICQIHWTKVGEISLKLAELIGYSICILIACQTNSRNYQFCFIIIMMLTVSISFSRKSFAGSLLPANGLTNFCAEYSFSLYLTHRPILYVFQYIYHEDINDLYRQKFIFLFCAFLVALAYMLIMRKVFKILPNIKIKYDYPFSSA